MTSSTSPGTKVGSSQASLELLSNLIYLAKRVTPGSELQRGYLDRAEEVLLQADRRHEKGLQGGNKTATPSTEQPSS